MSGVRRDYNALHLSATLQSQKVLSAYYTSKQMLLFDFAEQHGFRIWRLQT